MTNPDGLFEVRINTIESKLQQYVSEQVNLLLRAELDRQVEHTIRAVSRKFIAAEVEKAVAPLLKAEYGEPLPGAVLALSIDKLPLHTYVANALICGGIQTIGELVSRTEVELFQLSGIGLKALAEIKTCLARLDLTLKGEAK